MKNQPISKELLKRKLEKLDEWRTSIKCVVLPQVWREFVQKLCGRDSNRFYENIVRPPKRFSDSFSKEALEYRAKLHADDQAAIARQTGPQVDWLIDRIESVCNDAPVVLRKEIEEAQKTFDAGPMKRLLNDAVKRWSVREVSDPMSESVEQAHCSLVATVMSVIDVIEVGLTESLSSRPRSADDKTTPEVRDRIRELRRLNPTLPRDALLSLVKRDLKIRKLGFGGTLSFNQFQHALSAKSKRLDRKTRDGDT